MIFRSSVSSLQSQVFSLQLSVRRLVSVRNIVLINILLVSVSMLNAQHVRLNPHSPARWESEMNLINLPTYHTAVRPIMGTVKPDTCIINSDTIVQWSESRLSWKSVYQKRTDKEWKPDGSTDGSAFVIFPVYDLSGGFDLKTNSVLMTTVGGFVAGGDYRRKLGYEVRLATAITTLPNYQDSIASNFMTVPGWGDRAYFLDSGKYAFQHLSGNVIWRPNPAFNLQVGRDKHFWGDGHRSLFLSDIGAAFPYAKMQTTIWKLQYTSLFAWLQDRTLSTGSKNDFRNKFASLHYISFNAAKWLNIGVFEGVVWQGTDATRDRGFDPNYLNPLVFFRPVEYSLGSSDNAMLGIAAKIRFNRNNVLYGQIILDEFYLKEIKNWKAGWWANKQGIQVGYKCYNFGQVDNLLMQMEVNAVRPYTYSHGSPQQSYSHGGMPLAHPMGANFLEVFGQLAYNYQGFAVSGKLVGIRYGRDINDTMNYGQNVFLSYRDRESEYGNKLFQGYATNIFLAELNASYLFNISFPLRVSLTALARTERTATLPKLKTSYVMAGLSLPLWRRNADY